MTIRRTVAIAAAATLLLTSCTAPGRNGGSQLNKSPGPEDVNRMDPSQLKDGGELRWPVDELPANWNFHSVDGATGYTFRILSSMVPQTFMQKADGSVVVTYRLNPKAKWSDGSPLSWEDFDAQAKALSGRAEGYRSSSTTGYEDISKVERGSSDREVKVTFERRFAEWRGLFTPLLPKTLNGNAEAFAKSSTRSPSA